MAKDASQRPWKVKNVKIFWLESILGLLFSYLATAHNYSQFTVLFKKNQINRKHEQYRFYQAKIHSFYKILLFLKLHGLQGASLTIFL